jgi:hypothetical protein
MRQRKAWVVLIAVLLILAACKGESPTAPPSGGGPTTPPPSGVSVVLTTTNTDPLVSSSVTITATVTQNGSPVPDGTAVEFVTSGGFLDTSSTAIVKTTTGGIATVRLSAATAGPIRVSATVNNVTRTIDVTFRSAPVTPTPPGTDPTITSIDPPVGPPAGGTIVRIIGSNLKPPVRVLFNTGGPLPVEAFVNGVNDAQTQIEAVTPAVNLGTGQQIEATVIVITQAGTTTEQRAELVGGFTYLNEQLTPAIFTVTPNSGPVTGGTRVTIVGEAFQDPVQVLFNTAEARVLTVKYGEIIVETPAGRDTNPDGSGAVTGPVPVTVRNILSNTSDTMDDGFFYKAAIQITAAGPTEGPPTGGTRVTIDGIGFLPPVTVTIAGVAAQPIFVSGTRIIALTGAVEIEGCADVSGPIIVGNVNNGDAGTGPSFTYNVPEPFIVAVTSTSSPIVPGSTVSVRVLNAGSFPQLEFGDRGVPITGAVDNGDGTTTLTTVVPTSIELETQSCPAGGERFIATSFDIVFTNAETGCEVTLDGGLTVEPPEFGRLFLTPNPLEIAATADDPSTPADETANGTGIFNIVNTGGANLTITSVTSGNPDFTVTSNPTGTTLAPCESAIVVVEYAANATPAVETGSIVVTATTGTPPGPITATETVIGRTQ